MSPQALLTPRDGVPSVAVTPEHLGELIVRYGAGEGPVAVDAERASGYRYGQRAYLVQLRRRGVGTALIDPIALPDLGGLAQVIVEAEWVLHAASQDLPCLSSLGLVPTRLFDTELAGRLAGYERVGLATLVEALLGWTLAKEHSAADWSRRPLPAPWLNYAALDVEVLLDLRDALEEELTRQGKLSWAREEFASLVTAGPPLPRVDPWRRTSGVHQLRTPRQLAGLRELWGLRDQLARERDIAPGRLLPDSALISAVRSWPESEATFAALPIWGGRATRRLIRPALAALQRAAELADAALPPSARKSDGPPAGNRWADRDPVAAARLSRLRTALAALAAEHRLPPENLLAPEVVRRLAWAPPPAAFGGAAVIAGALRELGSREWQIGLTAAALAAVIEEPAEPAEETLP
ncbi:MAG: HRDC domain-containing protein [Mycobacteriales bacterium]